MKYCQHKKGYKIELQYQVKVKKIEAYSPRTVVHIRTLRTALHIVGHQAQTIMRVLAK